MKPSMKYLAGSMILAMVLVAGLSGCDSTSNADDENAALDQEIAASVAFIADDLSFDSDEAVLLKSSFVESDSYVREAGFLWRVATRLQEKMTDAQRERLMNRLEEHGAIFGMPGFHFGLEPGFDRRFQHRPGFGPFGNQAHAGAFADELGLTDDQKLAIRDILSGAKDALHDLHQQHMSGTLTDEDFRTAVHQLMEDTRVAWEAELTDDQLALLEQMKADREAAREEREALIALEREAAREVMIEVLGLDADQISALDELHEEVLQLREAFQAMIDGGATREEVKEWAEGVRSDLTAAIVDILDPTQLEIFLIHGALEARVGMRFRQMRHEGPGMMNHMGPGNMGPGNMGPGNMGPR